MGKPPMIQSPLRDRRVLIIGACRAVAIARLERASWRALQSSRGLRLVRFHARLTRSLRGALQRCRRGMLTASTSAVLGTVGAVGVIQRAVHSPGSTRRSRCYPYGELRCGLMDSTCMPRIKQKFPDEDTQGPEGRSRAHQYLATITVPVFTPTSLGDTF